MAATAKQMLIGKAPRRIELFGDKQKAIESATHIIEFPGGAIEVSRCTDGSYWAHIIVNHAFGDGDSSGLTSSLGYVVGSRIKREGKDVEKLEDPAGITQIAVRISGHPNDQLGS